MLFSSANHALGCRQSLLIAFVVVYKWSAFLEFLVFDSKKDSYLYWIEIIVEDYRPLKRIV
ncbi:hypothetical protein RBB68_12240 [Leptospira interrogans]|uniref:Uncharacterized protein n=3 Tax=Leptospira interrogans TaxID=173 RepID=A0AAQ0AX36_LEPIR|nr:hypothetical protein [Leptospira interrogans]EMF71590.1 hypothetical protein LEP1GSC148_4348 [Leptospira interrogans serovar Canicola str. LT1962]EMO06855.1 hypothetical protein LEP1GSC116_0436 [Leptospira interrogans serovar Icterohaemorrhagiae str. Verdun HP]ARB95154.1 hypothetical protein A6J42_06020 [Leptospira interrogans serovar Copenhageni]ASP42535.1 hypothetical protein AMR47_15960 [Leptospira interrogans]EKO88490.1 hypothetical protein LEP1GSC009_1137 [Leptospira interrogans serova